MTAKKMISKLRHELFHSFYRCADGIAAVFQNDPRGKWALGEYGGYLGYGGKYEEITPSVDIEFGK